MAELKLIRRDKNTTNYITITYTDAAPSGVLNSWYKSSIWDNLDSSSN